MKQSKKQQIKLFANYPDVMSVYQVGVALGIGRTAVYKLLSSNSLQFFRIGNAYKIPKSSLLNYMEKSCSKKKGVI